MVKKRKLEYNVRAVVYLLKQKAQIQALRDAGDVTASQILVDLDNIMKEAQPTDKQLKAVELVWVRGYKLKEAGDMLGITAQGVYFNLKLLKKKVQTVTERWTCDGRRIR